MWFRHPSSSTIRLVLVEKPFMINLPAPPSDAEWLAIGQALTFLTALLAFLQSRRNATAARKLSGQATNTQDTIQRVEVRLNGTLSQLLEAERARAHAAGKVEGILSERANPQIPLKALLNGNHTEKEP